VRILVHRKTGDTYGVIDFVYGDRPSDVIKTHVKENKLSTGDVLLKESINAIVRDMMKTAKINIPRTHSRLVF
jgi:exopolysaccharide biosynthesis protein